MPKPVTSITLDKSEATIKVGETEEVTATALPADASNKTINWTSNNTSVATVSVTESSSGTAVIITGVAGGNTIITATAKDGSGVTASCSVTVEESDSDWELLSQIAKAISDNSSTITNSSSSATVEVDGTSHTLNVGDTYEVSYEGELKTVRIIGFNHDKLTDTSAYGGTNTYAGISFDFVDFLTGTIYKRMNTSNTNTNGWAQQPPDEKKFKWIYNRYSKPKRKYRRIWSRLK